MLRGIPRTFQFDTIAQPEYDLSWVMLLEVLLNIELGSEAIPLSCM